MPADPVKASRIQALDGARGLALFGILILNIGGFALPRAAYMNPAYAGMPSFSDGAVWTILNVAAQGSFLAAFRAAVRRGA
ncbi:Predicted membrane protein [Leminorella grimontii]|nr:Predicted membrane protein [Leminorella grimontii]